jgi:chromosome segregation ATPase
MARRYSELEEMYSRGQMDLARVSASLDDANSLNSSLSSQLDSERVANEVSLLDFLCSFLLDSRDNLDRLYRNANNSLTILERSHRFTMADLDNHRHKLQESQDEILRLRQLVSSKDSVIKDLRASKRSIV